MLETPATPVKSKSWKFWLGAAILPLVGCCVLGTLIKTPTPSTAPTVVATSLPTFTAVPEPTPEATPEATKDDAATCKAELLVWASAMAENMVALSDNGKYLKAMLIKEGLEDVYRIDAAMRLTSVPTCEPDAQKIQDKILEATGMYEEGYTQIIDGKVNDAVATFKKGAAMFDIVTKDVKALNAKYD